MSSAPIPSMPMLSAIQDEPTRLALQQIVNAWKVRNGDVGDGSNKFLTADDLLNGFKSVNIYGAGSPGAIGGENPNSGAPTNIQNWINKMLQTIDDSVRTSRLWADLTANLDGLDQSIIAEQQARVAAIAAEAAARLQIDNIHGSAISTLETLTATQATSISGLTTRIGSAESTIINLQSTTTSQAQSLTSLTTRVGTAETTISGLQTTTASQANSLTALTARVGATETSITAEATARANGDSALTNTINTQVASINGNISTLQTQYNNLSTTTGVNSSAITSLQTSVAGVNTTAQSALTIASATSTAVNASWTVKFDANGYVVGAGLGLEGKNGTYTSNFVVIADKFLVARPDGTNPITMLEMGSVDGVNVLGFKGNIIGANGYFNGKLNASGGTFTGELVAATGTFAGLLQAGVLDLSRLQGYSEERSTPGTYTFTIQSDFPVLRYQLLGGGGGGGVGDYGEWNTRAGGGGGGGAGQYLSGTTGAFATGTIIRLVVGAGGAAGTEWQQNGGNGGATYLEYSTNGGSTWTTFVNADYGRGGACAPDAYYDNADGDWAGGAGGFGYPSGENPGGGDNWSGSNNLNRGGNGASCLWGSGGLGVQGGYGGNASGYGAGGAGGGFAWGWRNSGHSSAQFNGWYPGGYGTGGKAILEFFNPNAVVLQTTFNAFRSTVQDTINGLPNNYAKRNTYLGWSSRADYNNCGSIRYSGYEVYDTGDGTHQTRNYSYNCYDCNCNCSNCA